MAESKEGREKVGTTPRIESLPALEAKYRSGSYTDILPFAKNTSYYELAKIIPETPHPYPGLYCVYRTKHYRSTGLHTLLMGIKRYFELKKRDIPMDILSISGGMEDGNLFAATMLRIYLPHPFNLDGFYKFLGEEATRRAVDEAERETGLDSDEEETIEYTEQEIKDHDRAVEEQKVLLDNATEEKPFLNSIETYTPIKLPLYNEMKPLIYHLMEKERATKTILPYSQFHDIFEESMRYITSTEVARYYNVLQGMDLESTFMTSIEEYVVRKYIKERKVLPEEDLPTLMEKLRRALFELYIIQDLINDKDITDIKITDPQSIRVRIRGKAYLSDISFVSDEDYLRFVTALVIRNNINVNEAEQTFTDKHDKENLLRFTITMPYVSSNEYPTLHIRKISRKKMLFKDLINAGMMDEKTAAYLKDCGRHSTGVVFAGPPGSGKTIALNAFLEEAYEDSAEILVIQENDELFAYRKGVMFQHVVNNPSGGQKACSLEYLGQLALVAGANVFVIGEAKGAEICSAVTLANSGCRTSMTIHSRSSTETIDKMADLAMRGYAQSFEQAKRMMKGFETIVYLESFKVQEISQIIGYDEEKKDMIYRPIYRRPKKETAYRKKGSSSDSSASPDPFAAFPSPSASLTSFSGSPADEDIYPLPSDEDLENDISESVVMSDAEDKEDIEESYTSGGNTSGGDFVPNSSGPINEVSYGIPKDEQIRALFGR